MKDTHYTTHLENVQTLMKDMLVELTKDNQPEIRSRIADIKEILKL